MKLILIFLLILYETRLTVFADMIFEMKLIEYRNPSSQTYLHEDCGPPQILKHESSNVTQCNTGFLFCLVDLPFRNPQNCSQGDFATPVLGTQNHMQFDQALANNFTYQFSIKQLPMVKSLFLIYLFFKAETF